VERFEVMETIYIMGAKRRGGIGAKSGGRGPFAPNPGGINQDDAMSNKKTEVIARYGLTQEYLRKAVRGSARRNRKKTVETPLPAEASQSA